jgi:ribosomal protein L40E
MTKNTDLSSAQTAAEAVGNVAFIPCSVPQANKIKICDICGHANPETAALCKMCSNYLEGEN